MTTTHSPANLTSVAGSTGRSTKRSRPVLKWAGGKQRELKYIQPNLPESINRYFEPFVGGGAVYASVESRQYFINDRSEELISLYRSLYGVDQNPFFSTVDEIIHNWNVLTNMLEANEQSLVDAYRKYSADVLTEDGIERFLREFILENTAVFNVMCSETINNNPANFLKELEVNAIRKVKRMKLIERSREQLPFKDISDNIETALKSAFYMHFRHLYNHANRYELTSPVRSALFLFIRNYAYSGMFRYNPSGHLNVPYGGIGYNRISFEKKVDYLRSEELQNLLSLTTVENLDFEQFLNRHRPEVGDFIFLDPPYDTEFSTYAKNEFTRSDQARLANLLISERHANWMLVIKNTDLIDELYSGKGLRIQQFDANYMVSFMNRNNRSSQHLLITNY